MIILRIRLGIESQSNGANVINVCIGFVKCDHAATRRRELTHDAGATHFQMMTSELAAINITSSNLRSEVIATRR